MKDIETPDITAIDDGFVITNPTLASYHREADRITEFLRAEANLLDPAALTFRLNEMDAWLARLTDMQIRAKAMREYAKRLFLQTNEEALSKMTATNSNRIVTTFLYEFTITVDRLDTLYQTLSTMSRNLVTQISFIKQQMQMR